jgi:hypothetical protein
MSATPVGRISRISFFTDMTRADAPVIPLGFILEAAWPDQARWLGLIGRTRLTPLELDKINLITWPDLRAPFALLDNLFEKGWQSAWGEAGHSIQKDWSRSAFSVDTDDHPITTLTADTPEAWTATSEVLCALLNALHVKLGPALVAKPTPLRAPAAPLITRPIESRTRVGMPEALAA